MSPTVLFWPLFHSRRGDDWTPLVHTHCPDGEDINHQRGKSPDWATGLLILVGSSGELLYINGDTNILNTNYKLSSLAWPAEQVQEKISKHAFLSKLFLRSFGLEKITLVINVMNLFPKRNLTLLTLLGGNHWRGTDGDSEPSSRYLTPFLTSGLCDTYISSRW